MVPSEPNIIIKTKRSVSNSRPKRSSFEERLLMSHNSEIPSDLTRTPFSGNLRGLMPQVSRRVTYYKSCLLLTDTSHVYVGV